MNGRTRFVQAENFSGVLVAFTWKLLSKTGADFKAKNTALFARLEKNEPERKAAEVQ